MTFGDKLKALREQAGMTQAQLAEASGIPLGTIREYEQVKREPGLITAIRLARALDKTLEVFGDCTDREAAPPPPRRRSGAASQPPPGVLTQPRNPRGRPRKGN